MTKIEWFANEIIRKNISINWILNKARKLPYCRRNILITKIICWDKYVTNCAYDIISDRKCNLKDLNKRCKEYLTENKLANKNFIEFFFNFHSAIAEFYISKIKECVLSDTDFKVKITGLFHLFCELMNITRIELENFEIDCAVIGNNRMCKTHNCKNMPNIITLMITPEYVENEKIIENVIDSLKYITEKNKVILVVDYRNLCDYIDHYSWEQSNAYERYLKCKNYVKDIYFYKYGCVDFGKYKEELKPYLIKTKKKLRELYANNS